MKLPPRLEPGLIEFQESRGLQWRQCEDCPNIFLTTESAYHRKCVQCTIVDLEIVRSK